MTEVDTFLAGNGFVSRIAYSVVRAIVATVTRLYTRMTIDGRENIPRSGAFVLAPVHRSYVDTPIACCVTRRRLRYMGKDAMWKRRWFGWILSALGGFPVTRGTADREALKRCVAVLEGGEPLVLFPEGERKAGPLVQPLFDGAVYVALKAGVPIVPVGIGGTERAMPKGRKLPSPVKMTLVVGEPIQPPAPEPGKDRVSRRAVKELTDELGVVIQRLFDEAQELAGDPNPPRG